MDNKKTAAAMSAVMAYIRTQEEMAAMQGVSPEEPEAKGSAAGPVNLWGLNGRQVQMQMRTMVQMKSFHR
jgi:hypothetical protein